MTRLFSNRRVLMWTLLIVVLLVAATVTANATLRPGCSLLPVAVPDEPSGRSERVTSEQACAALGRPLPRPATLPDGVSEAGSFVSTGGPANIPRMVTVGYTKSGRGVGLLTVVPGSGIPTGNVGEINSTVAGVPAIVRQVHLVSLDTDDMQYLWSRDGLLISLHVQLVEGINREAADTMAASIR